MDIYEILGKRLKELRKQKKLTQTELGQILGFSKTYVAKVELAQTSPRFENILKFANYLGFNLQEIQDGTRQNPLEVSSSNQ